MKVTTILGLFLFGSIFWYADHISSIWVTQHEAIDDCIYKLKGHPDQVGREFVCRK